MTTIVPGRNKRPYSSLLGTKLQWTTAGYFQNYISFINFVFILLGSLWLFYIPAAAANQPLQLQKLNTTTPLQAVYLLRNEQATHVAVTVLFGVGEVDLDGPEGMSHYLEHLMFWHADKVNDSPYHGRSGNAWVNGVLTTYFNSGEPSYLDDMLTFATRLFSAPELKPEFMRQERGIVSREYDLRISENPDWRMFNQLRKKLYGDNPLGRSVIGTPQSIQSLTIINALATHSRFYKPANAIVLISGNITADQVQQSFNDKFKGMDAGQKHTQKWRKQPIKTALDTQLQIADKQVANDRLGYLSLSNWEDPTNDQDFLQDDYTTQMLQRILGSALPGSLAKPLRLDNFIVREFDLSIYSIIAGQFEFAFWADPDEGVDIETVSGSFDSALQTLAEDGITEKTLERVRKRWLQTESRLASDQEHQENRFFRALSLGHQPNTLPDHLMRIESVSLQQVSSLLKAIASPQRKATAFITPSGS